PTSRADGPCRSRPPSLLVERDGCANQLLQRPFVDGITFVDVNRACLFGVEPRIKETTRIGERSALEEVELQMVLEDSNGKDVALVCPHRRVPLPLLGNAGGRFQDELAQASQH